MNSLQQLLNAFLGLPMGEAKVLTQPMPAMPNWSALESPAYLRRRCKVGVRKI